MFIRYRHYHQVWDDMKIECKFHIRSDGVLPSPSKVGPTLSLSMEAKAGSANSKKSRTKMTTWEVLPVNNGIRMDKIPF